MTRYSVSGCSAKSGVARALGSAGLILALAIGGCTTDQETTGSIRTSSLPPAVDLPSTDAALRSYAADWGRKHDANPDDRTATINYARALRALTQYAQASAVLENAAIKHPYDHEILAAYGKALSDAGRLKEAADVLGRAHTPEHPDWTILSAQGTVADQMGDHAAALGYYQAALKFVPGEPTVLSNLGLSYALAKQLPAAEDALRQAAGSARADMRVRQNYALVLALEGKFAQAEAVARHDLSPADAKASVAAIRDMIAQSDTWSAIGKPDRRKPAPRNGPGGLIRAARHVGHYRCVNSTGARRDRSLCLAGGAHPARGVARASDQRLGVPHRPGHQFQGLRQNPSEEGKLADMGFDVPAHLGPGREKRPRRPGRAGAATHCRHRG